MWIHWWDVRKDKLADGRLLRPDTVVRLRSEHHLEQPSGYVINQLVPKFLRKWRGFDAIRITRMDAFPSHKKRLASVYWSEEWPLAGPEDQTGEAVYQPQFEMDADFEVEAFKVRCAYMFVSKVQHNTAAGFRLKPAAESASINVSLGETSHIAGSTTVFEAAAAIDPRVEISLLQGGILLRHLLDSANQVPQGQPPVEPSARGRGTFLDTLSGAATTYFAGASLPDTSVPPLDFLDPARPLRIEVGAPQSDDLRAAFSVVVRDVENGREVISDPVFLTSVRGQVIATDLPVELVSDESMRYLTAAAEVGGDIASLAQSLGSSEMRVWYHLVRGTRELGTASVHEAVDFAAYAKEVSRVPVL